jgi:7-cyano-7-deazaguanine synthase
MPPQALDLADQLVPRLPAPGAPAVVVLSGGMDSATVAHLVHRAGYSLHALSFRYGQRHAHELRAAADVARAVTAARHEIVDIDLRAFGGSALTADIEVPKDREASAMTAAIPVTYVPARNTIFLAFALAYAEVVGAREVFVGVNAVDYSGYPDCRPEYVEAFERMANLALAATVSGGERLRIRAPLIALTKADIARVGVAVGVDFARTHSCYDPEPSGRPCGRCDACTLRRAGFAAAGLVDPLDAP